MRAKTKKTLMWVGGGALVATGIYLAVTKAQKPATPAALPSGSVVTSFVNGQKYTFGAVLPSGVTDQAGLTQALLAAGWTSVNIVYFMGQGALPAGMTAIPGGYAATAVWSGATGAALPAGLVAVTA